MEGLLERLNMNISAHLYKEIAILQFAKILKRKAKKERKSEDKMDKQENSD